MNPEDISNVNLNEVGSQIVQSGAQLTTTVTGSPNTLLWGLLIIVSFVAALTLLRFLLHRLESVRASFKRKIFLVIMSKEAEEEAGKKEGLGHKKDIKEA